MLFIYVKLTGYHPSGFTIAELIMQGVNDMDGYSLLLVFVAMPLNWALEAVKWQYSLYKVQKITFINAFKGVLYGLSLGFITPHALGDYVGRVKNLKESSIPKAIGAVFLCRISLFYITLVYGVMGFLVHYRQGILQTGFFNPEVIMAISIVFGGMFILILSLSNTRRWWLGHRYTRKIWVYISVLAQYSFADFSIIFILSLARYTVFFMQYAWVLGALGVQISDLQVWSGIALVYFTKSVFPVFNFLSDVSIREAAALYFIPGEPAYIAMSGLVMWGINVLVPTFIGVCIAWFEPMSVDLPVEEV